jgi:Holliday junction DNA helicase RuvA
MIGSLRGKVILKDGSEIIIDVSGVGYRVLVSGKLLESIKEESEVQLFTYTHVKEDVLDLFGFRELSDLKLFKDLISVNGIGPRTAMTIFSYSTRSEILDAVLRGDVSFFTRIPRLGKKNAQKVIIELKSKLKDNSSFDLNADEKEENKEVFEALKTFGFSSKEINEVLKNIDPKEPSNAKIKMALKYLGK